MSVSGMEWDEANACMHTDKHIYTQAQTVTIQSNNDVIMRAMASQTPASPLFAQLLVQAQIKKNIKALRHWPLRGTHQWPTNSQHKRPVTQKMFPFDDVITHKAWLCRSLLRVLYDKSTCHLCILCDFTVNCTPTWRWLLPSKEAGLLKYIWS